MSFSPPVRMRQVWERSADSDDGDLRFPEITGTETGGRGRCTILAKGMIIWETFLTFFLRLRINSAISTMVFPIQSDIVNILENVSVDEDSHGIVQEIRAEGGRKPSEVRRVHGLWCQIPCQCGHFPEAWI